MTGSEEHITFHEQYCLSQVSMVNQYFKKRAPIGVQSNITSYMCENLEVRVEEYIPKPFNLELLEIGIKVECSRNSQYSWFFNSISFDRNTKNILVVLLLSMMLYGFFIFDC